MELKHTVTSTLLIFSILSTDESKVKAQTSLENPFLAEYNSSFEVPPFDQIKNEHFMPAFEVGMKEQAAEISAIYRQRSTPTFQNTIEAMENSGKILNKVSTVFFNLNSANTNDEIKEIAKSIAPKLSQHSDDIYLNKLLFQRVKQVYDQRSQANLNGEQERLLEKTYKAFLRSGANLSEQDQQRMRKINSELSLSTLAFGQNLLSETNSFELIVTDDVELSGLPESLKTAAKQSAENSGKENAWRFTLHNASVMPFLQYAHNRSLREKMYKGYINRANHDNEFDNKELAAKIAVLRAEKAGLLGYESHAHYVLEESMAKNPDRVYELLDQLWAAALPVAKSEADEMQKLMDKEGNGEKLEAWDWFYYANKVKMEKYNFMAEDVKPYFQLENVREGIFTLVDKLYGLSFTEVPDVPTYHRDAKAFEVKEADGRLVGVMYMDFFSRESKRGGAWMTSYRKQSIKEGKRIAPIVSIVCNFPAPVGNDPVLLTPDEVTTFFHEFGHALHGLLSDVQYRTLSGTSVPRDFVELPSQIMEHWAFEPEMLALYAKHYETGEVIPTELVTKLDEASKFNQGFQTVEYLAASLLDMAYHTLPAGSKVNVPEFEKQAMDKIGLINQIAPRYRSTYFQHIFAGGYSAGYYSYIWSEVLDSDAFATYKESGDIFDRDIATKFRKTVLEKGGTAEPMELYKNFRGREPEVKYLLKNRGLQ
ncbi:M3 family metallopeptidase [Albibacterium indicum]|uniref:M3 family metallopeptidase n=1 Tax=Albibacterium indicum TaxID=2292082 RepID=UPI000E484731|nr:M3 family metallopeptidase [Pedobacter indicus]